jgi:hypothetical protein
MMTQGDTALLDTDLARGLLTSIGLRPGWVGTLDFPTRFPAGFAR